MATVLQTPGCPRRRADVCLTVEGRDRHVLQRPHRPEVQVLNETARAIWDLCDGETTVREIVDGIVLLFGERRDIVTRDVERMLGELRVAGLLDWVQQGSPNESPEGAA